MMHPDEPEVAPANQHAMARERAGGLRLIRHVLVLLCCGVALNTAMGASALLRIEGTASDSNRASENVCRVVAAKLESDIALRDSQTHTTETTVRARDRFIRSSLELLRMFERNGNSEALMDYLRSNIAVQVAVNEASGDSLDSAADSIEQWRILRDRLDCT